MPKIIISKGVPNPRNARIIKNQNPQGSSTRKRKRRCTGIRSDRCYHETNKHDFNTRQVRGSRTQYKSFRASGQKSSYSKRRSIKAKAKEIYS